MRWFNLNGSAPNRVGINVWTANLASRKGSGRSGYISNKNAGFI